MLKAASLAKSQIRDRLKQIAMKKDEKSRQRLTLIEILTAIVFLTIIAAIAIPSYTGYSSNIKLKAAAKSIQADILEVQERAIAESTMYRIRFDLKANGYTIERGTETGEPYIKVEVKSLASFGEDVAIFSVVFGGGFPVLVFGPKGIAATGKVVLNNSHGSTATIAAAVSGRTYVQVVKQ